MLFNLHEPITRRGSALCTAELGRAFGRFVVIFKSHKQLYGAVRRVRAGQLKEFVPVFVVKRTVE